jgi:hypothetical protein
MAPVLHSIDSILGRNVLNSSITTVTAASDLDTQQLDTSTLIELTSSAPTSGAQQDNNDLCHLVMTSQQQPPSSYDSLHLLKTLSKTIHKSGWNIYIYCLKL